MNYQQAFDYIHQTAQFGNKLGLERIAALLERMGNPHKHLKFVHVAGTNGKGSVCAMAESILRAAGYKTGLYISPYVEDYCDRIQINRAMIPRDVFASYITEIAGHCGDIVASGGEQPRKFEMETAAGLRYFADQRCGIVVLEVGMGGRLDATNVIDAPEVAVIASISYDHTKILGETLEEIKREKRGIIKPGCAVVETANLPPAENIELSLSGSRFSYRGQRYETGLIGAHQIQNAVTAIETVFALRSCGWVIPDDSVREGLRTAQWGGRLEIVRRKPLCIIDGAHNQDAVRVLCGAIDALLNGRRIITVMAMGADKRVDLCVPMLESRSAQFIATQARESPNPLPAEKLAEACARKPEIIPDAEKATARAMELAGPDDVILACGSLHMINDAKRVMLT